MNFVLCPSGSYCNSASACFVASDGKNLRLYQAVVDARKLLDELSDPETSVSGHTHTHAHSSRKQCFKSQLSEFYMSGPACLTVWSVVFVLSQRTRD